MVLLGELSYAIYLSHQLIYRFVFDTLGYGQNYDPVAFWGSTYLLVFLISLLSYYLVETPSRLRLRQMGYILARPTGP
jgi:peptidoglycan/LPS O-acetylase OafA/YrhL